MDVKLADSQKALAVIMIACTAVALIVLFIDFQTKNAILEQVARYERLRGGNEHRVPGQDNLRNGGSSSHADQRSTDLLDTGNAGLETRNGPNGYPAENLSGYKPGDYSITDTTGVAGNTEIPEADQ